MAKFRYTALENDNKLVNGIIEAEDYRGAREKIRAIKLIPTQISQIEEQDEFNNLGSKGSVQSLDLKSKITFTSELATLVSSEISILSALESIATYSPNIKIKQISKEIISEIKNGSTFADSLNNLYGKVFGNVYVNLVKTGENSGELDITLNRMLALLKKQDKIKGQIIQASIYPCILIIGMFIVLVLFSTFVFPRFIGMLNYAGQDLPPFPQAVFDFTKFIGSHWLIIGLFIAGIIGAIITLFQNYRFKKSFDALILKIPAVSNFIESINLSNFLAVLQISYDAGVPIVSALEMSRDTINNLIIKNKVNDAIKIISTGVPIAQAFQMTQAVPDNLMSMIATGDTAGSLGKMLKDASDAMDKLVDDTLGVLTQLFGPIMLVVIAIFVLIIAIALIQAYASVLGSLG